MTFLDKLERALGRFAVSQLSLYLVIGQVGAYLAIAFHLADPAWFVLTPRLAAAGQWWRLGSFLLMPPPVNFLFLAFAWWIFYFMGAALEEYWGEFRYNLFLLAGYGLTVGLSCFAPAWPVTNTFLAGSVFLAFAYLNPEFEFVLFFILPVRIKWLALAVWIFYAFELFTGSGPDRLQAIAAVGNILLFFGRDVWQRAGVRRRGMTRSAGRVAQAVRGPEPRHRCRVCGKTDLSHPELDFRYCSKCEGDDCYCPEHIFDHEHLVGPPPSR